MPPATSAPYRFFESVRMRSARQISRAYRERTNAAPDEAAALADHGEDEVGVVLREEVELRLRRVVAAAGLLPGPDGDPRLVLLVALVVGGVVDGCRNAVRRSF